MPSWRRTSDAAWMVVDAASADPMVDFGDELSEMTSSPPNTVTHTSATLTRHRLNDVEERK